MADSNKSRAARTAELRDKESRRKPWAPPSVLETPEPPEGYQYRWLRSEMMGEADKGNMSKRMREGYEIVRPDELKESERSHYSTTGEGEHAGVIGVGGLILAKIPLETVAERNAYYQGRTQDQLTSIDNELAKNSNPVMPIGAPQRQSTTSFGNPENKPSAIEE